MNLLETFAVKLRHLPGLKSLGSFWAVIRPMYQRILTLSSGKQGLVRVINGMDEIRILPEWRALPEVYEPDVWRILLPSIQPGDVIVDVGAHFGLYAIALAKRTGSTGRVIAVEADVGNAEVLKTHVLLNQVDGLVEVVQKAVTDRVGVADWHSQDTQSVMRTSEGGDAALMVEMTTLDLLSQGKRVDVILIDIEGYEEPALRGAWQLLRDLARRPRLLVVEVHPYNWALCGSSSESFIRLLADVGYAVTDLNGRTVTRISEYGHVLARPMETGIPRL